MCPRGKGWCLLLRYLQGRGINVELAKRECKELHFTNNGRPFFAIGFPNMAGGYEVRNSFFKGCIAPKDITHIRQQGEPREKCLVFEGFMDYLSFLTLRMRNCPTIPDLDRQDYAILNSTAMCRKPLTCCTRMNASTVCLTMTRQDMKRHGLSNWNTPTVCVTSRAITGGIRT